MDAALRTAAVNTCEIVAGRLMEIRLAAGYRSVADVDDMIRMMVRKFTTLPVGARVVIAADWRGISVMSQETSERAKVMLTQSNPRVLRSSILIGEQRHTASLQVVRLVREADNQERRCFASAAEQYEWLAEVLTDDERARLAVFLGLAQP